MCNELFERIRGFDIVFVADESKVRVDQRMRLECGVGFRQLRTCRRTRPGQLWANTRSPAFLLDHRIGSRDQTGRYFEA